MQTRRILKPGQDGSKQLVKEYGDRLVCVRYIYDNEKKVRYKTVELIVDERPWQKNSKRIAKNRVVDLRVAWNEKGLQQSLKLAGGVWIPGKRVWQLSYFKVVMLGIENRIM